jgi:hypothetical protein
MRLKSIDYIYVLLSSATGVWQAWCFTYGQNSILIPILMSLPFALASYAYASLVSADGHVAKRPDWKRTLILWAGMPVSLVAGALTMGAETGIMYAVGLGIDNLPFASVRFLIGEGAACLVWAICLLVWSSASGLGLSRKRLLALSATLFVGVLFAYGLSDLIRRRFQKDRFFLVTSVVVTMISALFLVASRQNAKQSQNALNSN